MALCGGGDDDLLGDHQLLGRRADCARAAVKSSMLGEFPKSPLVVAIPVSAIIWALAIFF